MNWKPKAAASAAVIGSAVFLGALAYSLAIALGTAFGAVTWN